MAEFRTVCRAGDVESLGAVRVDVDGAPVAVFKLEDGELLAVCDTCTHEEASLSQGEVEDDTVYCPKHGAQFNLHTGKAMTLPATVPVKTYSLRVVDGDVQIAARVE